MNPREGSRPFLYLDPGFLHDMGHFWKMGQLLRREAQAQGVEFFHYVNGDVPAAAARDNCLLPVFEYRAWIDPSDEYRQALPDFQAAVDRILIEQPVTAAPKIFMYTGHPLHIPVLAELVDRHAQRLPGLTAHICLFYLEPTFCLGERADDYISFLSGVSALLESVDSGNRLTLSFDSDRTMQLYAAHFDRDPTLLPLPVDAAGSRPAPSRRGKKKAVIGYVGASFNRSGYLLMYELYKAALNGDLKESVEFRIKHTPNDSLQELREQFLGESERVTHIDGFLDPQEYLRFFDECDLIVLPYSQKDYPCQTSAILIETLLRGKPAIVPADTCLADQVDQYEAGEVFESGSLDSLIAAVDRAVDDLDRYRSQSAELSAKVGLAYSPASLLEVLLPEEPARPEQPAVAGAARADLVLKAALLTEQTYRLRTEAGKRDTAAAQERDRLERLLKDQERRTAELERALASKRSELKRMRASSSWRATGPLRRFSRLARRRT